ncbi:MAG TPA: hypothetical protein DET40_09925 [Lentisphaeria bacterium]|nr:MAG: hypothetical protein A2X45_08710 [Lentisphaerae bacterium GWF2_50_93]HCE43853.1 hypothetical protein [Lentisphaeria bacterium]
MSEDERNLNLLSIFHYVLGGLTALFSCFSLVHVVIGLFLIIGKIDGNNPPPQFIGWFFFIIGGMVLLGGWAFALATIIAGMKLKRRMSWTYCLVIAALECMMMPLGTILGVFTIIVLMKDPVKQLFAANNQVQPSTIP